MSRRKNILLLALLLLLVICGGAYYLTKSDKPNAPTTEEPSKPIVTAKIDTITVTKIKADTMVEKKAATTATAPKQKKAKVKEVEKAKESIEKKPIAIPSLGSVGEQLANVQSQIKSIDKSTLISESIDLPDVKHYVHLKYQRVDEPVLFVPKGQWLFGGNLQYSDHANTNYKLLVLDDWEGEGYTVNGSLYLGYAIKDNLALGVKGGFGRSLLNIDNVNLNLGDDLNFNVSNAHYLNQQWSGTFFMRNFISLFKSRQFGLFNDTEITLAGGRGKILNGSGETLKGTYESFFKASIGISPGIMVFMQDIAAIEVSVGLLGFNTSKRIQTTNQVYVGSRRTSGAKFGVDILSIKLGATFYLNGRNFKQR